MRYSKQAGRKQRRRIERKKPAEVVVKREYITEIKNVPMDRTTTMLADTVDLIHHALNCMGITLEEQVQLWRVHEAGIRERIESGRLLAKTYEIDFERYAGSFIHLTPAQFKAAMGAVIEQPGFAEMRKASSGLYD